MKRRYIICGTYAEFLRWNRENVKADIYNVYVSSPDVLRGLSKVEGRFTGSWYKRLDINLIVGAVCVANSTTPHRLLGDSYNLIPKTND